MSTFLYGLTIIGALIGGVIIVYAVLGTNSAPQQAAEAAIAIAFAVLPYCTARAVREMGSEKFEQELLESQRIQTKLLADIANNQPGASIPTAQET